MWEEGSKGWKRAEVPPSPPDRTKSGMGTRAEIKAWNEQQSPAAAGPVSDAGGLQRKCSKVVQLYAGPQEKNMPPWVQMQSPGTKGNGSRRTQKIPWVTSPAGGDGEGVAHGCKGAPYNSNASMQQTERQTLGRPRSCSQFSFHWESHHLGWQGSESHFLSNQLYNMSVEFPSSPLQLRGRVEGHT